MTPEQFRQVEALFHRGKDLPPAEQRAMLDAECGDDPEVRAEIEKLLGQADPEETLAALRGEVREALRPGVDDRSAATGGRRMIFLGASEQGNRPQRALAESGPQDRRQGASMGHSLGGLE